LLFAALSVLLAQEVSYHSGTSNLDVVNSLDPYTAMIAVNSSIQKTHQCRPASYSIESIRYVEDQVTMEVAHLRPERKHLCMPTEPHVIGETRCRSGSNAGTETFCPKRTEQKQNRNLWQYRALYTIKRLQMLGFGWGL
jgi:hypothetical protein